MRNKISNFVILASGLFFVGLLLVMTLSSDDLGKPGGLVLAKPAFAQSDDAGYLQREAGIAAYIDGGQGIDLARAKAAYRTLETETESYTIGSVALPDYPASEDVHVYVHQDGWIVAYYMNDEPASKTIDWLNYSPGNITTKLSLAIELMANSLGMAVTDVKYYHFNYPDASKLMIIVKSREVDEPARGTEIFKLTISSDLAVYERAWSVYVYERRHYPGGEASLSVDEKEISELDLGLVSYVSSKCAHGTLTVAELAADITHTVSLYTDYSYAHAGIVIVYGER